MLWLVLVILDGDSVAVHLMLSTAEDAGFAARILPLFAFDADAVVDAERQIDQLALGNGLDVARADKIVAEEHVDGAGKERSVGCIRCGTFAISDWRNLG